MNGDHLLEGFLAMVWLSARWAVVIAVLWIGLRLTKPRRIETRLLVCQLALVGGLLIAMVPVYWGTNTRIGTVCVYRGDEGEFVDPTRIGMAG